MRVTKSELQDLTVGWKADGKTIAMILVSSTPHSGHADLVQKAKLQYDKVIEVMPEKMADVQIQIIFEQLGFDKIPESECVRPMLDRLLDPLLMETAWTEFEALADAMWIMEEPPRASDTYIQAVSTYFINPPHYQDLIQQIGEDTANRLRMEASWAAITNLVLLDIFTWDTQVRSEKDGIRSWWQADMLTQFGKNVLILPMATDKKGVPFSSSLSYNRDGKATLNSFETNLQPNVISNLLTSGSVAKDQLEIGIGLEVRYMYKIENSQFIGKHTPGKNSFLYVDFRLPNGFLLQMGQSY